MIVPGERVNPIDAKETRPRTVDPLPEACVEDLSLHILDIAENALKAGATKIEIRISEDVQRDWLRIRIIDNGSGMDEAMARKVIDPFVTTRTERRVGLGLPLLAEASRSCGGEVKIRSRPGIKTRVDASFVHSHIDRKPLGDLANTLIMLIVGNPEINFFYYHRRDAKSYCLDTSELRRTLDEIPLSHPDVVTLIRKNIQEGLEEMGVVLW